MMRSKRDNRGFTLIETMVAGTILSATVLVVITISTMSLRGTRLNRQYEVAASLIDKQLAMIDFVGIDEFVDIGQMEGSFEEIEPGYHWEIVTEYQEIDALYLVTITVRWIDLNRLYSLTVDTMLDGDSTYIELELETEESTDTSGSD